MTNTQISNNITVSSNQVVDECFHLARDIATDILQGETSDYLFFYNGHGQIDVSHYWYQYVLLVGDFTQFSNIGSYTMKDVTVYQIYSIEEVFQHTTQHSFHGTEIDLDSSPISSFSCSGTSIYRDARFSSEYFTYNRDTVSVSVSPGLVCYSSLEFHPHLIEGVQNYAFAGFCLAAVVIGFRLLDRVFRRVY